MWFLLVLIPFLVVCSVAGAANRRRHKTSYASVDVERSQSETEANNTRLMAPAEGPRRAMTFQGRPRLRYMRRAPALA
jgi:hypothetical protein